KATVGRAKEHFAGIAPPRKSPAVDDQLWGTTDDGEFEDPAAGDVERQPLTIVRQRERRRILGTAYRRELGIVEVADVDHGLSTPSRRRSGERATCEDGVGGAMTPSGSSAESRAAAGEGSRRVTTYAAAAIPAVESAAASAHPIASRIRMRRDASVAGAVRAA